MATYAIGDIQGCYDEFQRLLDKLNFSENTDTLWLTGDLVNRGPNSLDTLRFVKSLGPNAMTVLGNHDLHLIAHARGFIDSNKDDTLQDIIHAPDCDELLDWLIQQPLLHVDETKQRVLVHAGILPAWSLAEAMALANEVHDVLNSNDANYLLENMYGNEPSCWADDLSGIDRLRFIVNVFTRMRYCTSASCLDFDCKSHPDKAPKSLHAWFNMPERNITKEKIFFGHWAALEGGSQQDNIIALDTGCVWGKQLTAVDIDTMQRTSVSAK